MKVMWWCKDDVRQVALKELPVFKHIELSAQSSLVKAFIEELSNKLLKDKLLKSHEEFVALGFWLRRKNIEQFCKPLDGLVKPVGLVVHYTPSNVDTMFVYSWVCSLLLGNRNIVRLSSRPTQLQTLLLDALITVLSAEKYEPIFVRNSFVTFDYMSEKGEELSACADARVLWGGDESVGAIRKLTHKPRCRDIGFTDRYSVSIVNGDQLASLDDIHYKRVVEKIWRDIKPYFQLACSSPKQIFWLGSQQGMEMFFDTIEILSKKVEVPENFTNEQLTRTQLLLAEGRARKVRRCGLVSLVELNDEVKQTETMGHWILPIVKIKKLDDITAFVNEKLQTFSYWGLDKKDIEKFIAQPEIRGIDRVVPIGESLTFSPIWDGYDLMQQLSRQVVIL